MRDADGGSVVLPVMLVGGTEVALVAMRPRNVATDAAGGRTSSEAPGTGSLWVWPLPRWNGYEPAISDGFSSMRTDAQGHQVKHLGVDIMYLRANANDQRDCYPPRTKHGSRNHFMLDATPCSRCGTPKCGRPG